MTLLTAAAGSADQVAGNVIEEDTDQLPRAAVPPAPVPIRLPWTSVPVVALGKLDARSTNVARDQVAGSRSEPPTTVSTACRPSRIPSLPRWAGRVSRSNWCRIEIARDQGCHTPRRLASSLRSPRRCRRWPQIGTPAAGQLSHEIERGVDDQDSVHRIPDRRGPGAIGADEVAGDHVVLRRRRIDVEGRGDQETVGASLPVKMMLPAAGGRCHRAGCTLTSLSTTPFRALATSRRPSESVPIELPSI